MFVCRSNDMSVCCSNELFLCCADEVVVGFCEDILGCLLCPLSHPLQCCFSLVSSFGLCRTNSSSLAWTQFSNTRYKNLVACASLRTKRAFYCRWRAPFQYIGCEVHDRSVHYRVQSMLQGVGYSINRIHYRINSTRYTIEATTGYMYIVG